MYAKFKIKVLNNSRLNDVFPHNFLLKFHGLSFQAWSDFFKPATNWSIIYKFLATWWRDILRDLLTQYLYFRTMSSFSVPNFDSAPRLARFPFTINSISIELVQQWLRAAIVKGCLSFEDEWFKVIVHPWGVRCIDGNSPGGDQKVKSWVQHSVEYVKHILKAVCRGE